MIHKQKMILKSYSFFNFQKFNFIFVEQIFEQICEDFEQCFINISTHLFRVSRFDDKILAQIDFECRVSQTSCAIKNLIFDDFESRIFEKVIVSTFLLKIETCMFNLKNYYEYHNEFIFFNKTHLSFRTFFVTHLKMNKNHVKI